MAEGIVFLLDVDNTLFDNDAFKEAIKAEARAVLGDEGAARFWELYEEVRRETQTVDFPRTLERLAAAGYATASAALRNFLDGYDFAHGCYPGAADALHYLGTIGTPVILSDGDLVFQPYKIQRAGLADLVERRVLIYVHKERSLPEVAARYPADHYVMIDDKARLLTAIKEQWAARVTTVFVRQGHYAAETVAAGIPPVDLDIQEIGALRGITAMQYVAAAQAPHP